MGANLRAVLDDLGIKSVDDIPDWAEQEVLKMVRARKPMWWAETLEQDVTSSVFKKPEKIIDQSKLHFGNLVEWQTIKVRKEYKFGKQWYEDLKVSLVKKNQNWSYSALLSDWSSVDFIRNTTAGWLGKETLEQNPMIQGVLKPNSSKYYMVHNSHDWKLVDKGKGIFGMDQVDYNVLWGNNVVAMELKPKKVFKWGNQRDVYKKLFGENIPEATFDFDRYDRRIYNELKKQGYDLLQYDSPIVGRWTENVVLDKSIIWKTKNMWSRSQAIEITKWSKIDKSHI